MARKGYDVWLGNNRGTRFSEGHQTLGSDKREYWDSVDWEEMGTKDVPAFVDFILDKTGQSKISYLGHSQGATELMAGASLMPDYYKSKFKVGILLAPPASMRYSPNDIYRFLAENNKTLTWFIHLFKKWNVMPYSEKAAGMLSSFASVLCSPLLLNGYFCKMDSLADMLDNELNNGDRYAVAAAHIPAGAGWKSFLHYGQSIVREEQTFKRYDYLSPNANR